MDAVLLILVGVKQAVEMQVTVPAVVTIGAVHVVTTADDVGVFFPLVSIAESICGTLHQCATG